MSTFTLYDVIQSELIKLGHDEFVDESGNWVFFDKEHQFIQKSLFSLFASWKEFANSFSILEAILR